MQVTDNEGKELKAHGNVGFPCAVYHCVDHSFPWHWHDEIEMIYINKGSLTVAAADRRYRLNAGDAVMINAGVPHALFGHGAERYDENDIVFHPRLLYGSTDSVLWERYFSRFLHEARLPGMALYAAHPWQRTAAEDVKRACDLCYAMPPAYEFAVREALTRVCMAIWTHADIEADTAAKSVPTATDKAKQMMRYLNDHYQQPITLGDIAAAAYLSPRECQRVFQACLGITPMRYLMQLRLAKAAELLRTQDVGITEICYQCGFQNSSYFAKKFHQRYGRTPREYRACQDELRE